MSVDTLAGKARVLISEECLCGSGSRDCGQRQALAPRAARAETRNARPAVQHNNNNNKNAAPHLPSIPPLPITPHHAPTIFFMITFASSNGTESM